MINRNWQSLLERPCTPLNNVPPSSRYEEYCEGYFATESPCYMLGITVKAAVVNNELACPGSTLLDEINAFDAAEVSGTNLGQLNVITVSSFCGPEGLVWGLDLCQPEDGQLSIGQSTRASHRAEVYDLDGLMGPFQSLIGTVDEKRFPFMPGSHVPAAMKSKTCRDTGTLYAALALGVPEDRRTNACLMMENTGFCAGETDFFLKGQEVLEAQAQSVLAIGENQRVRYSKVFVGIASVQIGPGQTGCAVAMAPYFRMAQGAFVKERDMTTMTIEDWEELTAQRFQTNRN